MSILSSLTRSPVISQYSTLFKNYFLSSPGEKPPVLTLGLSIFLVLVYLYSFSNPGILETWSLDPFAIYNLNLNKLTTYPLIHNNFIHLFLNLISLYRPLSQFEKANGTVHTGIVLNFLATITAVAYCLLGMLFYPTVSVLGASGWCFSMFSYFAFIKSHTQEQTNITETVGIPTILMPFVVLIFVGIAMPTSSFIGHLFAILAGFALGYGYLKNFTNPPFKIVLKIEAYLGGLIDLIPSQFQYIKEADVHESRYLTPEPAVLAAGLPLHSNDQASAFGGTGNVLGSS